MNLELAKRFARSGYFVFPTYKSVNSTFAKPFGWAGNAVDADKQYLAIPCTDHVFEIDTWEEQIEKKYKAELSGYGITGRGIIIFDIDSKNGKPGAENFASLKEKWKIPPASLIVKSKSGSGFHLFYTKSKKFKDAHIKSVANITIGGRKFEGVDIRGDGGHVIGPSREGEWIDGSYTIVKGSPESKLTELPEDITQFLIATHLGSDIDAMIASSNNTKADDVASILRRGELPDNIPDGARNESFFIFLNALKNKGIDRAIARQMAHNLAERCENFETLHQSVDIEAMLDRIFEKSTENPYDIAIDMVQRGLYQLVNHKNKPMYIMPCDNPYVMSKNPHDLASMREMLSKYARLVTGADGKTKNINPIDVAIRRIPDAQRADTIGYKPGAPEIFSLNDDAAGKRYLNMYCAPYIPDNPKELDSTIYEKEFKYLLKRLFGENESDDYQMILDFCAWFIQYPEVKCVITPFVISKNRGVGKSLLLNLMTRIYGVSRNGERQAKIIKLKDISRRFFDPTSALLNIIDEVQFGIHRNMRQEVTEFWRDLKNLVTADTVPVELKGGATNQLPNTAGLIMAGNTGNHFPIEELDRRVWIVDNTPGILERGVVDRLFDLVKGTGLSNGHMSRRVWIESIRYGLKNHKIKLSLDSIRAPMNDIKLEMMKSSMTDIEEWLFEYFNEVNNPIAETPIITRSMFVYMMTVSDQVIVERWRDEAELIFLEARKKAIFQPIKNNGKAIVFTGIPYVNRNGDVLVPDRKETLYTTREHGQADTWTSDKVRASLFRNLHSITRWKKASLARAKASIENIDKEFLFGDEN